MNIRISKQELRSHGCTNCIWKIHNQCPHNLTGEESHKDYICKDDEREVLKLVKRKNWHMENPPAHYVPGNGQGCYSWDSLGHRPQQKEYVVYAKRIFKIKGII